jgi:hypothetical protein
MPAMPDPGRDVHAVSNRGEVHVEHLARTGDRAFARLTVHERDGLWIARRIQVPSRIYYAALSELARANCW